MTPEGPALCLPTTQAAPTNVLLSSLVQALAATPTLVLLLDAVGVKVDEAASPCARANPYPHILPSLVHPNMAAVGGVSTERLQVGGGRRGDGGKEFFQYQFNSGQSLWTTTTGTTSSSTA